MFDAGSVIAHIKADVSDFERGLNTVKKQTASLGSSFASAAKTASVFAGVIGAAGAVGLTAFLKDASQEANNFAKSMTTLEIISGRFGVSADDAKNAAMTLGRELRIGTGGAAEALQNLLKSGLNLDQSTELLKRFTNEAMTGKAPTLSLGQAVQNLSFAYATNNSALGNLSGISENFSDITNKGREALLKEGKAASAITDDMAKLRGMMDLTNLTMGSSEKFAGTLIDTQAIMQQRVIDLKIAVGTALNPVLNAFLQNLMKIMPTAEQVTGAIQRIKDVVQGLATLITERDLSGPFLRALGLNEDDPIVPKILAVRDALVAFGTWIKENQDMLLKFLTGMAIAFGALAIIGTITALIAALTNPLTLIVVAVGLLYTAWTTNFLGIRDIAQSVLDAINRFWQKYGTDITNTATAVFNTLKAIVTTALTIIKNFWDTWGFAIIGIVQGAWNVIAGIFKLVTTNIIGIISIFTELFRGNWQGAWDAAQRMTQNGREAVLQILGGLVTAIGGVMKSFYTAFTKPLEDAWNKAKEIAEKIKNKLKDISPFTKHSPSLVENVIKGVGIIKDQYASLSDDLQRTILPVPGAGMAGIMASTGNASNYAISISMDGAFVGDELSATRLGEKVGDSIIRKLKSNVRF